MEKRATVSRILNFSCVDGPGNRLVLFLQGCNFNCINCHNPHTINHCNHCGDCVAVCPAGALTSGENNQVNWNQDVCTQCDKCIDVCPNSSSPKTISYNVTELLAVIRRNALFISGITVSGGEATLQLPFIVELFKAIKTDSSLFHLTCFIDSNGYLSESGWQRVMPYLDGAMIDLKAWQQETHHWLVGRDNHKVIASIRLLAEAGKLHELRLLHIPNKSDLDTEVASIARFIRTLPPSVQIRLNAFQHHGVVGEALGWEKCSEAQMESFYQRLKVLIEQTIHLPQVYL